MSIKTEIKLNDGNTMPSFGFGTWKLNDGPEVQTAVTTALGCGYRLIDTAKIYGNEIGVGLAVNGSGLPREDIFLTTKLWNNDHGYDRAQRAFEDSLERLGLDEVDLYLIHWPGEDDIGTWKALIDIHKNRGGARSIGVSNFAVHQLEEIIEATGVIPAVNQIEFNPSIFPVQKQLLEFCAHQGIAVEAYSPLGMGKDIEHQELKQIGENYGKSAAQVVLRWACQHGTIPIPKSANPHHIQQNIDIFDFELTPEDMEVIDNLGREI